MQKNSSEIGLEASISHYLRTKRGARVVSTVVLRVQIIGDRDDIILPVSGTNGKSASEAEMRQIVGSDPLCCLAEDCEI